jgi:putative RNA 2'-phosphotransferase
MNRHDVHLSPDRDTATRVGARRGRPLVPSVDAGTMHRDGHVFHVGANGAWLTQAVPPRYLRFPEAH